MEHTLHLAAKHFVKDVSPTLASALLKRVKGAMVNVTGEDNEMDLDALNAELDSIEAEIGEDDEADAKDYDVTDTVDKALALVTQV
jgi:hypothetical protein